MARRLFLLNRRRAFQKCRTPAIWKFSKVQTSRGKDSLYPPDGVSAVIVIEVEHERTTPFEELASEADISWITPERLKMGASSYFANNPRLFSDKCRNTPKKTPNKTSNITPDITSPSGNEGHIPNIFGHTLNLCRYLLFPPSPAHSILSTLGSGVAHSSENIPAQTHPHPHTQQAARDRTKQNTTHRQKTDRRQDKTRQDKTRQDKTRQDKTRQDKTRQGKTRQDKTRQDKTRQDKTSVWRFEPQFKTIPHTIEIKMASQKN